MVEALRNLWGNINEELLVYEERLEEVAQQREAKRRKETGSHRVRADEDDLYRRGQARGSLGGRSGTTDGAERGGGANRDVGEAREGKGGGEGGKIAAER